MKKDENNNIRHSLEGKMEIQVSDWLGQKKESVSLIKEDYSEKDIFLTIGVLPEENERVVEKRIFYDSYGDDEIQTIIAETASDLLKFTKGKYLIFVKGSMKIDLDNIYLICSALENKCYMGYVYSSTAIKNDIQEYKSNEAAFIEIFLNYNAIYNVVYKCEYLKQMKIEEWLNAMHKAKNSFVIDNEEKCCAYIATIAAPMIHGKFQAVYLTQDYNFIYKHNYVKEVVGFLNQWSGILDDNAIAFGYRTFAQKSFEYLEWLDTVDYVSDNQMIEVRDMLLKYMEKVDSKWASNGLRLEKVNIRFLWQRLVKKEKLSRKLEDWFYLHAGYELNLENPKTFNEKLNWMKIYDNTRQKKRLCDKYEVREWVGKKIGEKYLIQLIAAWDNVEKIEMDILPNKFVLKVNQGSGFNIVVEDKQKFDIEAGKKQLAKWMAIDYSTYGYEMQYQSIKPIVLCEEYLENNNEGLHDYKVHVFGGKAKYIQYISGRTDKRMTGEKFFDLNWNPQNFYYTNPPYVGEVKKPKCVEELIYLAEKLGEEFAYVRVDFYILNSGEIKFGEMTFTPTNGMDPWRPTEMDSILGELIDIGPLRRRTEL
ncbi:hypothetical protein LJC58_07200 [Lachnospiraceae bacterium OttesenSCG-928-D06]|nr:hypothetical protein [Lachnospiraceae bacterium OttesenSCG-928-D06]